MKDQLLTAKEHRKKVVSLGLIDRLFTPREGQTWWLSIWCVSPPTLAASSGWAICLLIGPG